MLLSSDVQASVTEYLQEMQEPVTVKFYGTDGEEAYPVMRDLWQELAALASGNLLVESGSGVPVGMTRDNLEGPVSELWVKGQFSGVRYLGIPGGHEFSPFIQTLVETSRNQAIELSAEAQEWLAQLQSPVHLQVFVTPT